MHTVLSEKCYCNDHDMTGDLLLSSGFFSFSPADPSILAASLREPLVRSSLCKVLFLADGDMQCSSAHTGDTSDYWEIDMGGCEREREREEREEGIKGKQMKGRALLLHSLNHL